ncbi:MAG: electron transport complex subunit E [Spirochaetes bacterium]|nr:electron transport complex subunit E [Spirochaetota bacterium]
MIKQENSLLKEFTKGIIKENPSLIILLGLCPTLAVTTSIANGIGMGIAASAVLICSNIMISLLKNYIPEQVRIPAYIVVIASFVTIVEMLMKAYVPLLAKTLGIFVPLIVVNCIILGRAEAFANKKNVLESIMDALGMGLGFTLSLLLISMIREIFGYCWIDFRNYGVKEVLTLPVITKDSELIIELFGKKIEFYKGIFVLAMAPGAFFVIGLILAVINYFKSKFEDKEIL